MGIERCLNNTCLLGGGLFIGNLNDVHGSLMKINPLCTRNLQWKANVIYILTVEETMSKRTMACGGGCLSIYYI